MSNENPKQLGGDTARAVIGQLWLRARINAFAHREAATENSDRSERSFERELIAALVSILFIIFAYIALTMDRWGEFRELIGLGFTVLSILMTLWSMYESIMANYRKLDVRSARHEHLLNSFQYLAQRARESKWPDLPTEEVEALLRDLERDFALLKATGTEPADRHFDAAHRLVKKIKEDSDARIAQSFEIGHLERVGQHVGDPTAPPEASLSQEPAEAQPDSGPSHA